MWRNEEKIPPADKRETEKKKGKASGKGSKGLQEEKIRNLWHRALRSGAPRP
ncbi:hypothetical protein FH972_014623 [Carpinus fangiana]|uniref:Uncharacterized protein n=1 Tax=Carpinus fangiana TaxID=176857 RepID=A0A5N6RAC4_9ROSI|nr:hypothetical protein FH972_014623 [Carpinus fangiana]